MNSHDISAGVRTVTHVADYFAELKQRAADLLPRLNAQQRGYFTPNEEDEMRALLVSYWQARSALFDLITSFRLDTELADEDRPAAFLTAYAGALVLIDAARFLREAAHHKPVARNKLNEPVPEFGLPGGLYDTIQQSLVSARHVWHLYHAIQYYDSHRPQLQALAATGPLQPVLAIIERLRDRLNVTAAQYARTRLRTRGSQIVRSLLRDTLGRALYGLQKFGSSMISDQYVRPGHHPQLPDDVARRVLALLAPGDVLVVRKEYALTNYFLPGYWPHAALYLGDAAALELLGIQQHEHVRPRWARLLSAASDRPQRVLESMKDGVLIRSLESPFASDSIVVLRPRLTPAEVAAGLSRVMCHEGKCYDFDFDFTRSDRLVCTEVVYRAYDGIASMQFPLTRRAGRLTLSGGDLVQMAVEHRNFDPVAVFAPGLGGGLMLGESANAILRSGLKMPVATSSGQR